jgi:23S rRNA (adenine2030-N6)-methyltransferase
MIIVNPPYTLEQELKLMLPALCEVLKTDDGAKWSVDWLAGEAPAG